MQYCNEGAELTPLPNKRVLISTLYPLGGNYGGMLQAYALQRVLKDLGLEVATINSDRRHARLRLVARRARAFVQLPKGRTSPKPLEACDIEAIQERTREFISNNISTVDFFGLTRRARKRMLAEIDLILVGSDQVWRGGYADVDDQLLQFAAGYPIKKASYAASFGAEHLVRFSPRLIRKSRELIRDFAGVSVREKSGIRICREIWGVKAECHIDPALLLTGPDYLKLVDDAVSSASAAIEAPNRTLLVYVLDRNAKTDSLIGRIAKELGLEISELSVETPNSPAEFWGNPGQFRMKSVEAWISAFSTAEFVVTDSFHGTVFSIIFHKSFVAIGNRSRGLARFESLLSLLNLESHLISAETEDTPRSVERFRHIDWASVEGVLTGERERSLTYLARLLNCPS